MGIRSPLVKPDLAICDPALTYTLPPRLTAATGMDAVTHCVEGYLSINENGPTEAIALDGIYRAVSYIDRAASDGSDKEGPLQYGHGGARGRDGDLYGIGTNPFSFYGFRGQPPAPWHASNGLHAHDYEILRRKD